MKTHFKSTEIAHVWAHQSAPQGNSPGAMSFNGPAISSYGTEIARHITFRGKAAIIVNDTSYSKTTSKHQGQVQQAIAGLQIFHIDGVGRGCSLRFDDPGKNLFEYAIAEAARSAAKAEKARLKKDFHQGESMGWLESAKAINEFFGLRRKVDEAAISRLADAKRRTEKRETKARAARELKQREEQAAGYAAWLKSEDGEYFNPSLFPVAFRVEGDELVSTLRARVPLDAAKVAFRFTMKHRGQSWHRNGETCPVGHYQLDAINPQGIVAGCHRIAWDEVERLATVLA